MRSFKDLREDVVKSADKKPEVYIAPDGKKHVRMVPVDKQVIKTERKLTPGEKKKREEIAKAMERDNPGMDMKKKMAIATWQAKKVAEAKGPKIDPAKMAAHMARNVKPPKPKKMTSTQKSLASIQQKNEEVNLDEASKEPSMFNVLYTIGPTKNGAQGIAAIKKAFKVNNKKAKELMDKAIDFSSSGKIKTLTKSQQSMLNKQSDSMKEEVNLDEISKKKLGDYAKAATMDVSRRAQKFATTSPLDKPNWNKSLKKLTSRQVNIHKAIDKLAKEGTHGPEGEKGPYYKDFSKEFEKKKLRMTKHIAVDKKAAMEAVNPADTGGKEETDMAMGQLKFMQHAIEGIMARVQKDGDMEEWFQNKLTKAHEDLKTLYSYSKGEQE